MHEISHNGLRDLLTPLREEPEQPGSVDPPAGSAADGRTGSGRPRGATGPNRR